MTAPALPPAPEPTTALDDRGTLALAASTALGAWWGLPFALAPAAAAGVAVAWIARRLHRPILLLVAGFVVASALGARAREGLTPPVGQPFEGVVTLVGDPRPAAFGTRADVRTGVGRFELQADGAAAGALEASLAGEQLWVHGRLRAPARAAPWLEPRHVRGYLRVDRAERHGAGSTPWRAANRFRRLLEGSVDHLDRTGRSLYRGMVLGDSRAQPPEVIDDFRGAGLTHLLVVSGQNLAFVLVLVGPAIRRLPHGGRWAATVAVVAAFAVVTRFEPSVLRASAMAVVAVSGQLLGRPSPSLRNLALAVTGLVLIDPLLVRSVAFQLSAAASAAIARWSQPLADACRGPRLLRDAIGVTAAAQLGVAPVIIPRFGGLPVASLPANVMAGPVAAVVTTWGLPAGVATGALEAAAGVDLGHVVHLPTQLALWWVAEVARVCAALPLGELGMAHVAVAAASLALLRRSARPAPLLVRGGALAALAVAMLAPALVLRHPPPMQQASQGVEVHREGGATVVVADAVVDVAAMLGDLRRSGIRRVDRLVVGPRSGGAVERAIRHRWPVSEVVVRR